MKLLKKLLHKIVTGILLPIAKGISGLVYRRLRERYRTDEKFRQHVDAIARRLLIKHGPKVVQLYYEVVLGQSQPPDKPVSPEQGFVQSAENTAKAGYEAAKKAGQTAGKKASDALARASQWLRAEAGQTDTQPNHEDETSSPPEEQLNEEPAPDNDEPTPSDESPADSTPDEDLELKRLKERLERERTEAEAKKTTRKPSDVNRPTKEDLDRVINGDRPNEEPGNH